MAALDMLASDVDDVNDDDSLEGAITQSLFRTESESDEEEEVDGDTAAEHARPSHEATTLLSTSDTYGERPVLNILLAEKKEGPSIAEKLWPAAQHLAKFVMDVQSDSSAILLPNNEEGHADASKEHASNARATLKHLLQQNGSCLLRILELGAGVGLTGLHLGTCCDCRVLLTDLPEAMPLLERNITLNQSKFVGGTEAVTCQVLAWGNENDAGKIVQEWKENESDDPILILASDCVYWSELHLPLEQTLAYLLSNTPDGSLCLIAGARRWKKDTKFYAKLGKATKSETHGLVATLLDETVTRNEESREIMRVYSVEWLPRNE